jgi:O-antigen/teichoic acid export membrane protein
VTARPQTAAKAAAHAAKGAVVGPRRGDLVWNIVTTILARVSILALALVSSVVLARMLGAEGRGLFALVLLLPELARSLGHLGFEDANAVYAGLEPAKRPVLVWQSAAVGAIVGGAIAAAGIGYLALRGPGAAALIRGPLWLYAVPLAIVPIGLVSGYWGAIIRGMNRILAVNGLEVGARAVSLAVLLWLVGWWRLGVAGAVWTDALLNIGTMVCAGVLLWRMNAWGRLAFDWALWRRSKRFALPTYLSQIGSYANYRADQFIIGALLPPEQLGFYVVAVGLAERLWILTGSVGNALLPHMTHSRDRSPALPALVARHVMVWTAGGCLVLFVLAEVVVRVLYSAAFTPSVAPLRWILPGILAATVGKVVVAEMMAREQVRWMVWVSSLIASLNIVANLVLVPRMGISGAAVSSTISYSALSLIVTWYYLRETGLRWTVLVPRWTDVLTYRPLWLRVRTALAASRP